jgi:N-acetyl-anhydromuramyl-L-alanine amidase AmpD
MNTRADLRLPTDSYFADKPKKDLIVLHHTVGGSARSTYDYWRIGSEHIGTAYIVERDGTVYEVFPPECWAYHLGLKIGPQGVVDKRSIGIEIASEGPLLARDSRFYAFGRMSEQTEFKGLIFDVSAPLNNAEVLKTAVGAPSDNAAVPERTLGGMRDFRGYRYFAAYTPQAIASVCELVEALLTTFNIPRQTPDDHTSFNLNAYRDYTGVLTHCQLRADKSDCHPGFDWPRLIVDSRLQTTTQIDVKAQAARARPSRRLSRGRPALIAL